MKAKNQHFTSDFDAKEKLIVYVYEYLVHMKAKQAADLFKETICYNKEIKVNEGPGFLEEWWVVFWDLYCAAPDRRHSQPESSSDARAFHDFMRPGPMSPSVNQTSPPQHGMPPHQFMGGPRYGPPPPMQGMQPRMPRMSGPSIQHHQPPPPPPQNMVSHPGGSPGFMPVASPRYAQHPGPNMNPNDGMFASPGPEHNQISPSPSLNRMTPIGGPPSIPPNGLPPQMVGSPMQQQMIGQPPPGPPPMQNAGPPRNGSWQGNMNYGMNPNQNQYSSSNPNTPGQPGGSMMMSEVGMMEVKSSPAQPGEPQQPHPDEYMMQPQFVQDNGEQMGESAEIMKLKQSMQDESKMFEKDQSEFGMGDYSEGPNKWT